MTKAERNAWAAAWMSRRYWSLVDAGKCVRCRLVPVRRYRMCKGCRELVNARKRRPEGVDIG